MPIDEDESAQEEIPGVVSSFTLHVPSYGRLLITRDVAGSQDP